MVARDKGAKGLMVVSGPTAQVEKQLVPLTFDASLAGTSIAALSVSDEVVQQWFKSEGEDLRRTQEKLMWATR